MRRNSLLLLLFTGVVFANCTLDQISLEQYPSTVITNEKVRMKIYLPDPENGLYQATRFDWSGVIGSVKYKGHEYFGYWKETHDPTVHEDLTGPVEGYLEPGLGYAEAEPGTGFIRIGVGIIKKIDEPEYKWMQTYEILDHGNWNIEQGKDWILFTHEITSDFGYGYVYKKTIRLKNDGFVIEHLLRNTGEKAIETDQFNHNFFMIDGAKSGPGFKITFPFSISTEDDPKGYLEIGDKELLFINELNGNSVFLELSGYSKQVNDHQITVVNDNSGAGVSFSVDRPLTGLFFWACETTLSPENFIWISVEPGDETKWASSYDLFVKQ